MSRKDRDNLTERISIRFTPQEIKRFEALAASENERKVSSLLRRILVGHLKLAELKPNVSAAPRTPRRRRNSTSSPRFVPLSPQDDRSPAKRGNGDGG